MYKRIIFNYIILVFILFNMFNLIHNEKTGSFKKFKSIEIGFNKPEIAKRYIDGESFLESWMCYRIILRF